MPKLSVDGKRGEREICVFDDPATAVLVSRTGAYFRDWFEPILKRGRCCYYLMKMVRPACSRKGSLAVVRLPYSEL